VGASFCAIFGYWGITAAMRLGEISAIAPFRYVRLVFALIIGIGVFSERPDAATYSGAALIISSGIYSFWRERQVKAKALAKLTK
jgi:drug/metabolite transporter (DMT)-like permease